MGSVPFCGISFDPPPVTAVHLVAALQMPIGKIVSVPFSSIVSLMKFLKSELRSALETSFRCRRKASREITRYRDKMSGPTRYPPKAVRVIVARGCQIELGADRTLSRDCSGPCHQERGYNLSHRMNESSCPAIGRRVGICEEDDAKHDGDEPEQRKWIRENTGKCLSAHRIQTACHRVRVEHRFTGDPVSHSSG